MNKNIVLCTLIGLNLLSCASYGMEEQDKKLFKVTVQCNNDEISCTLPSYDSTMMGTKKTPLLLNLLAINIPNETNNNISIATDTIMEVPRELGTGESENAHKFYTLMFNLLNCIEVSEDKTIWRMIKAYKFLKQSKSTLDELFNDQKTDEENNDVITKVKHTEKTDTKSSPAPITQRNQWSKKDIVLGMGLGSSVTLATLYCIPKLYSFLFRR